MGSKDNYHVVPNPHGGWDVARGGAERASNHFDTKEPAMQRARDLAEKSGGERIEHKKDGTIRDPDSYGNDPPKIRDKVR